MIAIEHVNKLRIAWLDTLTDQAKASAEHERLRDLLKKYPNDPKFLKQYEAAGIAYGKERENQAKAWERYFNSFIGG